MDSILDIADYAYGYPESDSFVFRDIRMVIKPGECHCITGPTGVGKSTLLMAIQGGLLPRGNEQGRIRVSGNGSCQAAALVMQNPETQILTTEIGAEVAFGLENLCVPPDAMKPIVLKALRDTGLDCPLDREARKLSMGQKYRLILSALLVMNPHLIMVDEPSGQLDTDGLKKLKTILKHLKSSGRGVLISEHRPGAFADVTDVYWAFDENGSLNRVDSLSDRIFKDLRGPCSHESSNRKQGAAVVAAKNLTVVSGDNPVWSDVNFEIFPGEMVAVCGKNGTGKTTLMRSFMGSVSPDAGEICVFGEPPAPQKLRGRVGCLFQDPSRQLFEESVFDEVAFQLRRSGKSRWREKVQQALTLCGISELAEFSPHKLSYGQQHLVAMAMVIADEPALLLLDDPFTGLDQTTAMHIFSLLHRLRDENNTTVIVTTHHPEEGLFYDRRLLIADGRVIEEKVK